jgi:hypothetical protein
MLHDSIRRVPDLPDLALARTCRQIHTEFLHRFYALSQFIITVLLADAFLAKTALGQTLHLPEKQLQLSKIRNVVLVVSLEQLDGGSYNDIDTIVHNLPAVWNLTVAFTFQERMYIHRENAERWRMSALLLGMVCTIVQAVPKSVDLSWVNGTEVHDELRGLKWSMGACSYIPKKVLSEMAGMFAPLRGTLAPRVSKETESFASCSVCQ